MRSTTILLVEDNPGDVFWIKNFLAQTDAGPFNVTHVDSLGSALACLKQTCFDLALLDLFLPDSHGMETLLSLQKKAPSLPTVVLAGLEDTAFAEHLIQNGAQDF